MPTRTVFDIGATAGQGIAIHGGRIQEYTNNGWDTTIFKVREGAAPVAIDGVSIGDANLNYVVDAPAQNITKDGYAISHRYGKPSFMVYGTTSAAAAATLVNGTDFITGPSASSYFASAGITVDHNNGGVLNTSPDGKGGAATATHDSYYEFCHKVTVRAFDRAHTAMEVVLIKNIATTAHRYVVSDDPLQLLGSTPTQGNSAVACK